jgi:tetratricopeptide (TPR) repeat protein
MLPLLLLLLLQSGNLALAKQHYRRALQKASQHFTTATYLQLGDCFMASGDARVAADMYAACITAAPGPADQHSGSTMGSYTTSPQPPAAAAAASCASDVASGGWISLAVGGDGVAQLVPGRCASVWLKLALAYVHGGDTQSAELALSEANLCDPENAGVWGHLALLALQQVSQGLHFFWNCMQCQNAHDQMHAFGHALVCAVVGAESMIGMGFVLVSGWQVHCGTGRLASCLLNAILYPPPKGTHPNATPDILFYCL